jgi:hypothetical protein
MQNLCIIRGPFSICLLRAELSLFSIANVLVLDPTICILHNSIHNGILISVSLPVIYLGPPSLLGSGMLRSGTVGLVIGTAAAASPLCSRP